MKQFPLFVPSPDGPVVAVVTVPDSDPYGVVLLLAGTGRHNVIGSTLSALLSDRLAAHRLASVRLDYQGVGDSPGTVTTWSPADIGAASEQARAALAETSAALGVSRFASVGTCYGSRVALELADEAACVGAVCLAPPLYERRGAPGRGRGRGKGTVLALLRSNGVSRRLILEPVRKLTWKRERLARSASGLSHLDRLRIVFLYGRNPVEDHYSPQVRKGIDEAVASLPAEQRARFDIRMLASGPLTTFDGLAHADQEAILDAVVPFVLQCFEGTPAASP
jgi:pimeloyl-ACP methyl ester carboxylesterase